MGYRRGALQLVARLILRNLDPVVEPSKTIGGLRIFLRIGHELSVSDEFKFVFHPRLQLPIYKELFIVLHVIVVEGHRLTPTPRVPRAHDQERLRFDR